MPMTSFFGAIFRLETLTVVERWRKVGRSGGQPCPWTSKDTGRRVERISAAGRVPPLLGRQRTRVPAGALARRAGGGRHRLAGIGPLPVRDDPTQVRGILP